MLSPLRWWWVLPVMFSLGVPAPVVAGESAPQASDSSTPAPASPKKKKKASAKKREPTRTRTGGPVSTPAPKRPAEARKANPAVKVERAKPAIARPSIQAPKVSARVPFEAHHAERHVPAWQTTDHRYGHPAAHHVPAYPHAGHPPPHHGWYRPWYTHWWVHPYYRWVHVTHVVVWFEFAPDPWVATWAPPARAGWVWVPGHYAGPLWVPGHWAPAAGAPAWYGARWVFVPGWWMGPTYIEGYWRVDHRSDGDWVWVEGAYQADGSYIPGYWKPSGPEPAGYTWEPGFWNGEDWVEGYWRPVAREGYAWVRAHLNSDGTFEAGYWEPLEQRPGMVWVPGWFDGETWQSGYWVEQGEYDAADPDKWTPPEGVDEGWNEPESAPPTSATEGAEIPLALPAGST